MEELTEELEELTEELEELTEELEELTYIRIDFLYSKTTDCRTTAWSYNAELLSERKVELSIAQ